jgi:hypothetical protein
LPAERAEEAFDWLVLAVDAGHRPSMRDFMRRPLDRLDSRGMAQAQELADDLQQRCFADAGDTSRVHGIYPPLGAYAAHCDRDD